MGFSSEEYLFAIAQGAIRDCYFNDTDYRAIPEFDYNAGRTDLVVTKLSDAYLRRRVQELGINTPIHNQNHLRTFLQLHVRGAINEDTFLDKDAVGETEKRNSLQWLKDHEIVEETADGKIQTRLNLRRHVTTTYAFEMKLKDWKTALRQAYQGRSFADYRYVVMDDDYVLRAVENRDKFNRLGVGLVSIKEGGDLHMHWEAERSKPFALMTKWRLNESTLNPSNVMSASD